jgi:geranylgeranyl pyrophosphate synthase
MLNAELPRTAPGANAGQDPGRLFEAMRYAVLGGGKRLRPCLVLATYDALLAMPVATLPERVVRTACSLELVHAYSLVHDDLPAMDNADTRRGQPSVHRKFGEATAVLVGDALLTLAFEWADATTGAAAILAKSAGAAGMILGQARDLAWTQKRLGVAELERLHAEKTGALFAAATALGGLCADQPAEVRLHLTTYGEALGVLFQHADDVEDGEHVHIRAALATSMAARLEGAKRALRSAHVARPAVLMALLEQVYRRAATLGA